MFFLAAMVAWIVFFEAHGHGASRTEAMSNQRQVGLALLEFDQEFGEMPSDATVAAVVKLTGSTLDFSDGSSNAMFRQLIAYGIQSEDIFYAKHPGGTVEPDNDIHGKHALAVGEVGFSYVEGLNTSGDPETPVLLTPMKTASFDQAWYFENYDGVVVLRLDNSVDRVPIRKSDEKPVDEHGVPILDAAQPYFGGKWPDVRHPTLKP